MSNICLIPMIGLPAAGKTFFARKAASAFKQKSYNCLHVCYDILLNTHEVSDFNKIEESGIYKQFRLDMLKFLELLIIDIQFNRNFIQTKQFLSEKHFHFKLNDMVENCNYIIFVDDNNYYRSMRYEIFQIAKKFKTGYFNIFFCITLEESIIRNSNRNCLEKVPEHIIKKMHFRLEIPSQRHYWEKFVIINQINENLDINLIEQMILDRLKNYEYSISTSFNQSMHITVLHEIDLLLRKHITDLVKSNVNIFPINMYASELNKKRKQLLNDLKKNIVEIPKDINEIKNYFAN